MSRLSYLVVLLVTGVPALVSADDFRIALEPGVAIPLSEPQSKLYDVGGGQSLKALFGISPYLSVGPTVSFLLLPSSAIPAKEAGIAWGFGGGMRLARPFDAVGYGGMSPWLDLDLLFVRTGDLNRPGFDVGAGATFPIDAERRYRVGPFVRYEQTLGFSHDNVDSADAKTLLIGLTLEVGSSVPRKREAVVVPPPLPPPEPVPPPPPPAPVVTTVVSCPDRDQDGVPDSVDRCPDVAGSIDSYGCPGYQKVIVHKDKLELKEKLYFAWDKATLEPKSFPILDDVVQALKDNPGFHVEVQGHTDASGARDHNQKLSEQRAATVLEYLTAHGIAKDRLVSKGFGPTVPLDTNDTVAGRENNRRVEFLVNQKPDGAK